METSRNRCCSKHFYSHTALQIWPGREAPLLRGAFQNFLKTRVWRGDWFVVSPKHPPKKGHIDIFWALPFIGGLPLVVLFVQLILQILELVVMVAGVVCLGCSKGR